MLVCFIALFFFLRGLNFAPDSAIRSASVPEHAHNSLLRTGRLSEEYARNIIVPFPEQQSVRLRDSDWPGPISKSVSVYFNFFRSASETGLST